MKEYKVIKVVNNWSSNKFVKQLEETLNKKSREGWTVEETKVVNSIMAYVILSKRKGDY